MEKLIHYITSTINIPIDYIGNGRYYIDPIIQLDSIRRLLRTNKCHQIVNIHRTVDFNHIDVYSIYCKFDGVEYIIQFNRDGYFEANHI